MRFTVIGHSCVHVEAGDTTLLVDPWLSGSCYWRSWWLFPPSAQLDERLLSPRYVYLTHHHFDHFHYPTLRRLDRDTVMLVPRFGVDVMVDELHKLGFRDVRELDHGEVVELGDGLRVASYQYGFDDTALVVAHGEDVLVDLNDCKIRGRSLRRIVDDFGTPTFMLKSYSWAQAYPNCYTADDPRDLGMLSRESYAEDFIGVARELRPRYAVPFGSMIAFLHPETREFNAAMNTPGEILRAFKAAAGVDGTELMTMVPGDSWSRDQGFTRSDTDWFTDRQRHLDELAASVSDRLAAQAEAEAGVHLSFAAFREYFEEFLHALPPATRLVVLKRPVVFEVPSATLPYWVIDFRTRTVHQEIELPPDTASVIRVPEAVLVDAIRNRIVNFVHISMRMRTHLFPGGTSDDLAFWGILAIWEIGYLPVHRVPLRRLASVAWRRRLEGADMLGALRGRGSVLERMSTGFAVERDEVGSGQ
jgi:UDP-MurNAc hydroxylase